MTAISLTPTTGVVVTGAASGIGRATARALAAAGRAVALWDLDGDAAADAAAGIAKEHGVAATGFAVDVRVTSALAEAVRGSAEVIGPIGGLVHAAGVPDPVPVEELTDDAWDRVFDVNLRAYAMVFQAVLPDLRANGPGSAVVGISSLHGFIAATNNPAYAASKAGVMGLTRQLGVRYGREGIRVNAICPGYIDTPMIPRSEAVRAHFVKTTPMARLGQPEEVARVARFLLSDEASFVNGTQLLVDGGRLAGDL